MKVTKLLAAAVAAVAATSAVAATAGAYNGYISWQSSAYSFRNDWNEPSYGAATPYFNSAIVWGSGDAPEETYPDYADNFDWDINGYVLDANYTDCTIDGDGTYTVSMDGYDWSVDGCTAFNLVGVSTDIPVSDDITITDIKLIIDGTVVATQDVAACEGTEYLKINVINTWNTDALSYSGSYPTDSLAVEFTVNGLGGGAAAETPDAPATDAPSKGSPDTGVEGVAAVAGLAIVAGGAVLLSKKRK